VPTIFERDPATGKIRRSSGRIPDQEPDKPKTIIRRAARAEIQRQFGLIEVPGTLQALLPKAMKMLEAQIEAGDAPTVIWFLDRMIDKGPLAVAIPDADLSSFDGVMLAAQKLMKGMTDGAIPLVQVERALSVLSTYTKLKATEEIKELRELLQAIEEKSNERQRTALTPTEQVLPPEQLPSWGNLRGKANGKADEGDHD
jgi:hypothetical protein